MEGRNEVSVHNTLSSAKVEALESMSLALPTLTIDAFDTPQPRIEFGDSMAQGQIWRGSFGLLNNSKTRITHLSIAASCGCTVLGSVKSVLEPGETQTIDVEIDLTGKKIGMVKKTLTFDFQNGGKVIEKDVELSVNLKGDHPVFMADQLQKKLFSTSCASCHYAPGVGKYGRQLFKAVCAFCHGENGEGASAVSLRTVDFLKGFDPEAIKKTILDGGPSGMPAFAQHKGGPLTDQQVDSIVEYFKQSREDHKHLWE